jgi:DNA repair photolyase
LIDVLTNSFLENPVPIQFTGNYCSHNCSYCFANINNPKRKLDIKVVLSQLKNYKKRNDLVSYYMREKYPILISNNIDPFSKSNQPFVNDLILQLKDLEIPVVLATRGGIGWQEIIKELPPTVFYVSIPYDSEDKKNKYEPQSPSINERWQLVKMAKEYKHQVVVAINPLNHNFATNHLSIAEKAKQLNVKSLLINKIHLSPRQQSNLTEYQKELIGEDILVQSRKSNFEDKWLDIAIELNNYTINNDMQLMGFEDGSKNKIFIEWQKCYQNILPTKYDFFNFISETKKDNDLIYFDDFYNYFEPKLPNIETNISKFIFNKTVLENKASYKKQNLKNLLSYYWQTKGVELGLAKNYPIFSWAMKNYNTKQDFIYDNEHNKVLVYHPNNYNTKDYLIIE